jgi:hypothetical protein
MPLKHAIREQTIIQEYVTAAVCNVCGREEPVEGAGKAVPQWPPGFHVWDFEGGWGDEFPGDLEKFRIVVCEECLRKWVGTFKHPDVLAGHRMGWSQTPHPVRDSETLEDLHVLHGWAMAPDAILTAGSEWDEEFAKIDGEVPPSGSVWEHFKGNRYLVHEIVFRLGTAEPMVMYQGLYGDSDTWVRPLAMWADQIDRPGYSGPRFQHVRGGDD